MQTQYFIKVTHWAGNRYSITDGSGKEIYTVRTRGTRVCFFPPGSDSPRFEIRSNSFLGWKKKIVETAVDYTFGYLEPKELGKAGYEVLDVARNPIGTFRTSAPTEEVRAIARNATDKSRTGMRETLRRMAETASIKDFILSDGRLGARYKAALNRRSIDVTVLEPTAKNMEERIILALAIFSLRIQNNGGG